MLYRTQHRFSFSFNPFTPFPPSTPTTTTPPSLPLLSSSSFQAEHRMEGVEGALKTSLRPEMAVKAAQQAILDDLWVVNGQNGVAGDDFFVDDLLDFSKGGIEDGFAGEEEKVHEQDKKACCPSVLLLPPKQEQKEEREDNSDPSRINFSVKDEFGSLHGSELSVPADDLADLEWLSHFVDDSFSEYSLPFPAGKLAEKTTENRSEKEIPASANPCFATPVQTKARTKRTRTGGRVWSLGSPSLTETSSSSSSTSSSSTSLSSPSNPWLIYITPSQTAESFFGKSPPVKKQRKKLATEFAAAAGGSGAAAHPPRRCSHCLVQKTPQWRTGPLGAKTLCNACGVRYKSGRLLPEYRPACSPTFSSEVHSNNHRKVLEMRRKKEVGSDLASPVQSF